MRPSMECTNISHSQHILADTESSCSNCSDQQRQYRCCLRLCHWRIDRWDLRYVRIDLSWENRGYYYLDDVSVTTESGILAIVAANSDFGTSSSSQMKIPLLPTSSAQDTIFNMTAPTTAGWMVRSSTSVGAATLLLLKRHIPPISHYGLSGFVDSRGSMIVLATMGEK